jgi:hypothetical protein
MIVGAALAAVAAVLAFRIAPTLVDRIGAWRKSAVEAAAVREWTTLSPTPDSSEFAAYCASLASTRSRDRKLPMAKHALRLALATALRRDDVPDAVRWGRALVALDNRDLANLAEVGRLLLRDANTAEQGLGLLRRGAGAVPDSPIVVPDLVQALVRTGAWDEAARVLVAAIDSVQANRWDIRWSDHVLDRAWVMPVASNDDARVAQFSLHQRPAHVSFELPWRVAMELRGLRLWSVDPAGRTTECGIEDLVLESGLERRGADLIANGAQDARFRVPAEALFARRDVEGPWTVGLHYRHAARLPDWLSALCLGDACGAIARRPHAAVAVIQQARARGLRQRPPTLACRTDDPTAPGRAADAFSVQCGGAIAWCAEWTVAGGASAVAVELPAVPGVRHRVTRAQVRTGAAEPWQPVPLEAWRDLRPEGDHFVVVGPRPRCELALARAATCSLQVDGEVW